MGVHFARTSKKLCQGASFFKPVEILAEDKMFGSRLMVSLLILVGLLFCVPTHSQAMMVGLSTKELTGNSELALVGRVEKVNSHWNADGTMIFTTAEIRVEEPLKGDASPGQTVTVTCEGGEVGNMGLRVSDSATFTRGEKVIVFLEPEAKQVAEARAKPHSQLGGAYKLVGKAQGKYTVDKDGIARKKGFSLAGKSESVENDIPEANLVDKIKREVR